MTPVVSDASFPRWENWLMSANIVTPAIKSATVRNSAACPFLFGNSVLTLYFRVNIDIIVRQFLSVYKSFS